MKKYLTKEFLLKLIMHSALGLFILYAMRGFVFLDLKMEGMDAVGVVTLFGAVCSGVAEGISPTLKLGKNTAGGIMRTMIPIFIYFIYNLLQVL